MKYLRLAIAVFTIFSINHIDAMRLKRTQPGATPTQPRPAAPAVPAAPSRPASKPARPSTPTTATAQAKGSVKTFKQLFDQVKNMPANKVLNSDNNLLSEEFIANMVQEVNNAGLGEFELTTLLLIARDKVPFTGNDAIDLSTLKNIKNQIENATTSIGQ